MVVEDDLNIARELKFILTVLNYEVFSSFTNGEEAIQSLEAEKPEMILMDIELSGDMNGIETALFIREKYDIPIIFTTSHAEGSTIEKAKKAEPHGYIVKPLRENDIKASLEIAFHKHKLEKVIKEKDELLQTVIETSPDLIFVKDSAGKYILANQTMADVYGTTPETIINKTDFELAEMGIMDKRKVNAFVETDKKVIETQQPVFIPEEDIIFSDGRQIWTQTRKVPLSLHGKPDYVLGIVENITELKNTENDLSIHREHLRLINKILRHDLTNDLAIINSSIKLFEKKDEKKYLEDALRFVNKSVQLINRMRDLEKFISSHSGLHIYDVKKVVNEIIKEYPDIEFQIDGTCKVLANDSLRSVIDNLIRNAIYHGKTKKIEITVFAKNEKCYIKIADYGKGIPTEIHDKIFEENFTYGETGQTGIGLFIVKKSMEQLGGNVFVENNRPCGAVFTLSLKLVRTK
jgi:PAS domain S-box-containing protein